MDLEFYLVVLPIWFEGATIEAVVHAAADLPADHVASWAAHSMIVPAEAPAADPDPVE